MKNNTRKLQGNYKVLFDCIIDTTIALNSKVMPSNSYHGQSLARNTIHLALSCQLSVGILNSHPLRTISSNTYRYIFPSSCTVQGSRSCHTLTLNCRLSNMLKTFRVSIE